MKVSQRLIHREMHTAHVEKKCYFNGTSGLLYGCDVITKQLPPIRPTVWVGYNLLCVVDLVMHNSEKSASQTKKQKNKNKTQLKLSCSY